MAPERPRRKPQVFPKNPNPRRFFGFFLIAQKETRRRSGETSVSFFRGYSACGRATFQRRKVAKVLRACGPGPRGVALFRWQSRPARCPHEGCLTVITAALLNELDRLLLHGTMRLSGAAYTVGGGRRAGEDTRPYIHIGPRAATSPTKG